MAKLVKLVVILVAALVGIGVIAVVAVVLFFDPNDYRDDISAAVRDATGRELTIDGELSFSLFPWLALEAGRTTLGNAEGFGDEPMVRFERARLSVQLMPLILRRQVQVGTAALEGFEANLAVAVNGRTNWDDLAGATDAAADEVPRDEADRAGGDIAFDIASVELRDAVITYTDEQSGSRYTLSNVNFTTGRIAFDENFGIEGAFDFSAMPGELSGDASLDADVLVSRGVNEIVVDNLSVRSTLAGVLDNPTEVRFDSPLIVIDTINEQIRPGELDLTALGLNVTADVDPIDYAVPGTPPVRARIRVADFSLKQLLAELGIEPPETADDNALERLSFEADASIGEDALALSEMTLVLDDTTLTGELAVPLGESGALAFDLRADSITLDNYMAPAVEDDAATEAGVEVEVPVELIRALEAGGTLRLDEAFVGPVRFTAMELGVNSSGGRLRLHPISARFFDGSYAGDVRIDTTVDVPTLSVNEKISDVDIASMMQAMYDVDNVTGTINAGFELSGAGQAMSAIAADLDGSMQFELLDGAWQGVDVWHQLRTARALYKREQPPEPRLPARTEFTSITASGNVLDGVFANDNLVAQLPFLRITGAGMVDLAARELDYSVQARILAIPEFMSNASEDELADFTEALIPIRITGPLSSPNFRPDIEAVFRQEVERAIDEKKEELRQEIFDRILGDDAGDEPGEGAGEGTDTAQSPEEKLEDELKNKLKELFPR